MPEITMPRLSDSMEEGTILKWLKSDGDEVSEGDELAEIETDKATMTYEADAAGVLEIVADEGQTLAIGEVIAKLKAEGDAEESSSDDEAEEEEQAGALRGGGERPPRTRARSPRRPRRSPPRTRRSPRPRAGAEEPSDDEEPAPEPKADDDGGERVIASPVARRLARERGVDLGSLRGTGPGGRIVKADVEGAPTSASDEGEPAEQEKAPEAEPARHRRRARHGQGRRRRPGAVAAAGRRRPPHGGVQGDDPGLPSATDVDMEGCVDAARADQGASRPRRRRCRPTTTWS